MRHEPYTLPPAGEWTQPADVAVWAELCLAALDLTGWSFGWDRAVRRLGCCSYGKRRITLSRHYVAAYLEKDATMVRRTVLHELAHALAMVQHRERGHGRVWRLYCNLLGIAGEKASCKCDDFAPPGHKRRSVCYELCHRDTGEVFRQYRGKPRLTAGRLAHMYIVGRRDETLGKLMLRRVSSQS
ncbi:MAG: SprT-like domain-containing protein [Akkermansia sp.]|nr:SprT-like domain-containing protein [Akkermansia sp.]